MPVLPLLGVLFIGLKLTGYIAWSWLWVLAPFWAGLALVAAFLLFVLLFMGGVAGITALMDRR